MESDETTEQGSRGWVSKGSRQCTRCREANKIQDLALDLQTVKLLKTDVLAASIKVHTLVQEGRGSQNQGQVISSWRANEVAFELRAEGRGRAGQTNKEWKALL